MYLGGGIEVGGYLCHRVDGFVGLAIKPTFVIELPKDSFFRSGISFHIDIRFSITNKLITFCPMYSDFSMMTTDLPLAAERMRISLFSFRVLKEFHC